MQTGMYAWELQRKLTEWTDKHKNTIGRATTRCLRHHLTNNTKPFGNTYGTLKAHKNLPPDGLPSSRPIVNTLGSLSHAHACLLDNYLQPIAQSRQSYLKTLMTSSSNSSSLTSPLPM